MNQCKPIASTPCIPSPLSVSAIPALPTWTTCYLCGQSLRPQDAHWLVWSEHRWCAEEERQRLADLDAAYDAKLNDELRDHYAMLDAIEEERDRDYTLDWAMAS